MAKCNHNFIPVGEVSRYPRENNTNRNVAVRASVGVKVVCAMCGLVKGVYEDGYLEEIYDPTADR